MTSKAQNIKSFYKPVAKVSNKRPLSAEDGENSAHVARRHSPDPSTITAATQTPPLRVSLRRTSQGNPPHSPNRPIPLSIRSPKPKCEFSHVPSPSSPTEKKSRRTVGDDTRKDTSDQATKLSGAQAVSPAPGTVIREKVIIKSSDDEDSDSLSSLEDLLGRRDPDTSSSPPDTHIKAERPIRSPQRSDLRRIPPRGRMNRSGFSSSNIAPPRYKFSLDSLVAGTVDDDEVEAGVAKAREEFDELHATAADQKDRRSKYGGLDTKLLASVVDNGSESGKFQRLMNAVDRTEAFSQDLTWKFFDTPVPRRQQTDTKFPSHLVKRGTWEDQLLQTSSRQRAFLSGYVGEAWSGGRELPDDLINWIFDAISQETRDDLRYAYCKALKTCLALRDHSLLDVKHIERAFRSLGALPEALTLESPITPIEDGIRNDGPTDWKCLLSFLGLLDSLAPALGPTVRETLAIFVCRLMLDSALMCHGEVSICVERLLGSLLNTIDRPSVELSLHRIGMNLFDAIKESQLQRQLLRHILPQGTAAPFRVNLATAFLLKDAKSLDRPLQITVDLDKFSSHLQDKRFRIETHRARKRQDHYDYTELAALTYILDAAVDNGTSDLSFSSPEKEKAFNAKVDILSDRIKAIFTSIEDRGAQNMRRTEAKESLEALYYRIVYSVRTKPPPKKVVFGGTGEEWEGLAQSEALMQRFLASNRQTAEEKALGR